MIFIRLQAANDNADVNDLRAFTTPELFSSLQARPAGARRRAAADRRGARSTPSCSTSRRRTTRQIVSVRFHGLIREEAHNGAEPFDEVWHLVRPADGKAARGPSPASSRASDLNVARRPPRRARSQHQQRPEVVDVGEGRAR